MTAALIALLMKVPFSIPKKDIWHNVGKVVKSAQVIGILFIMTMAGMADGYANRYRKFVSAEILRGRQLQTCNFKPAGEEARVQDLKIVLHQS